jgi:hypothetical protein
VTFTTGWKDCANVVLNVSQILMPRVKTDNHWLDEIQDISSGDRPSLIVSRGLGTALRMAVIHPFLGILANRWRLKEETALTFIAINAMI